MEDRLDELGLLGDVGLHAGVDAVPDLRHREQHRRLDLADELEDALALVTDGERGAEREHAVELDAAAVDVRPGQKGERAVIAVDGDDGLEAGHVAGDVGVREADALRLAGGARRIDEEGDVARLGRDGGSVTFLAGAHEGGEPILARRVEIDDMLERRKLRLEGVDPFGDGVAGDEADARAAVAEDVAPVTVELRLVHRDPDGAERERRVGAGGPFEAVVADDGEAVATLDAARDERGACLRHEVAELGVGGPLPAVGDAGAEGGSRAELADGVAEHGGEVVEARLERHGRRVYRNRSARGRNRSALALALQRGTTARWRPMRWTLAVAAAALLVAATGACGDIITVPDQGIIVTGCQMPAQCWRADCACTGATLSSCVEPCQQTDPNDPSTCYCMPATNESRRRRLDDVHRVGVGVHRPRSLLQRRVPAGGHDLRTAGRDADDRRC